MNMLIYLAYIVGIIGTWIVADGVASLWTYLPKGEETFWRNHALRIFRSLLGVLLVIIGILLIGVALDCLL